MSSFRISLGKNRPLKERRTTSSQPGTIPRNLTQISPQSRYQQIMNNSIFWQSVATKPCSTTANKKRRRNCRNMNSNNKTIIMFLAMKIMSSASKRKKRLLPQLRTKSNRDLRLAAMNRRPQAKRRNQKQQATTKNSSSKRWQKWYKRNPL